MADKNTSFARGFNQPVRGVWLTNVDSQALLSSRGIQNAVNLCDSIGINTIFVVTFNKAATIYPSEIMRELTGQEIIPALKGRDPLKELVALAHKKNIKVIAWFEFGFSASYKMNGGEIIKHKPDWAAMDADGKLVSKNGFEWMNGFMPEVQDFLLSLIMEVVHNYDVDGIQGDDRLPAMPSESGYDKYTVQLYKNSHDGNEPPKDFRDTAWVQWRADILTDYMKRIHDSVKNYNENLCVSMAPSIYPWSKEEYLQDWPLWVEKGYVDLVIPQIYRYKFTDYQSALKAIIDEQIDKKNLEKFYPGFLLNIDTYVCPEDYLRSMIEENRKNGINGEVYFFYEGIKKQAKLLRELYKKN